VLQFSDTVDPGFAHSAVALKLSGAGGLAAAAAPGMNNISATPIEVPDTANPASFARMAPPSGSHRLLSPWR
jgi:hypothetical protein